MKGPIISVDVSNGTSHFQGFIDQDKAYGSVRKIIHDVEGFSFFLNISAHFNIYIIFNFVFLLTFTAIITNFKLLY